MIGLACVTYIFRLRLTFILFKKDLAVLTIMDSVKKFLPSLSLRAIYYKFLIIWVSDLGI
jgi:hypothetical protein